MKVNVEFEGKSMIVYKLRCDQGHSFEAWFRNSSAFEDQRKEKLVECPNCGSKAIEKAPMAPNLSFFSGKTEKRGTVPSRQTPTASAKSPSAVVKLFNNVESLEITTSSDANLNGNKNDSSTPQEQRLALKALENLVRTNCQNVGGHFPEEVRKMHYGETKKRNIFGHASAEEIVSLYQEGIEVVPLPPFPKEDA